MSEQLHPDELAAAERLDRAVDDVLAGRPGTSVDVSTSALLARLVAAHRDDPPPALAARIGAAVRRSRARSWLPARVAAAALGLVLVGQGFGNLVLGHWIARNLHTTYDEHLLFEGGVVLLALGCVVLAGAVDRRLLDLAVVVGAPVGLSFAIHGSSELTEFPAGGVLHLTQGVCALALALLWWRARRYGFGLRAKRGHEN